MKIIVISDTHIKFHEKQEDYERRMLVSDFLNSLDSSTDLLVLNGDIFDLWFDWKTVIIKGYYDFVRVLENVRSKGIKIVMLAGNHDFWFNGFLEEQLGIEVYDDIYQLEDGNKKFLFTHGDKYTTNDIRYLIFRSLLRNKVTKAIFNVIHPEISLNIGKYMSRSSRNRQDSKDITERKGQGLKNFAEKMINKGYDFVAMGHSHNPQKTKVGKGYYLNSGDWIKSNTYLEIIDGKANLIEYKKGDN